MQGVTLVATAAALLSAVGAGCATSNPVPPPAVPEGLRVDPSQVLILEAQASGVQIYQCRPSKDDPASFKWVFKEPEADLFDRSGTRIGKHYAGPTWESTDGSTVVGEVRQQDSGPDPTAISWLLLQAKSSSGTGVFSRTHSIQRLNTVGGKAPAADGCSRASAGTEARAPYRAAYFFYGTER
jgi:FtsP/CotA-like multicopper oxidase with cupredoxin domain